MKASERLDRIRAYEGAVAHPFHVRLYPSWEEGASTVVGFQTEQEARDFAASRPEPIVDLVRRERGPMVIATRRLVAHPAAVGAGMVFVPRDDFPVQS